MESKVKHHPLQISGKCPVCENTFYFDPCLKSFKDIGNCTTDCNHCGALLLIENNEIYPFNEKLHEEDSRWPTDGKGTGYIEVNE